MNGIVVPEYEESYLPIEAEVILDERSRFPKFWSSELKAKRCSNCGVVRFVNLFAEDIFVCKSCR